MPTQKIAKLSASEGIREPSRRHLKNPLHLAKVENYYRLVRHDVIRVAVEHGIRARRVLELGCATGETGKELKRVVGAEWYVGIELDEKAAQEARAKLDEVYVADIETVRPTEFGFKEADFDLVVALDVLEHLRNPWDALADLASLLRPGGHALLSIPNIQNLAILAGLAQGRWTYTRDGLLDATHLRFFTWGGIVDMLAGAGLSLVRTSMIFHPKVDLDQLLETNNAVTAGNLQITGLTKQELLRLCCYQYIVIGQRQI